MDEITLFTSIQPAPPGDTDAIRQAARARLADRMSRPHRSSQHRRRPLVLSGGAAAGVALAVSLLLLTGGWPVNGEPPAAVHVNLAAWSVNTNPNGTVTFKLRRISDPTRLEHVLAQAGVPAIVRWGENCREQRRIVGAPAKRAVSGWRYVGGPHGRPQWVDRQPLPNWAFTITPSAMPTGARLVISAGPLPANEAGNPQYVGPWIDWALVPAGAHVTCGPSVPPEVG